MKVAVYSCNFGDYRKEMEIFYSVKTFDPNIHYYFFTENRSVRSDKWKIIYTNLIYSDTMKYARQTSKHIKFVRPDILKSYDILVWIDCKQLLNKISYNHICNLFKQYPEYSVFNLKHPKRSTAKEELECTIRMKLENKDTGTLFLQVLEGIVSPFLLPETSVIILKNTEYNNYVFRECYKLLNFYKLKRDQNIYNYALHNKIIPKILPTISSLLNGELSPTNPPPSNCVSTTESPPQTSLTISPQIPCKSSP